MGLKLNLAAVLFFLLVSFVVLQRLFELRLAKKNTKALLKEGAVEFGGEHYWVLVSLHTLFFVSLIIEAIGQPLRLSGFWPFYLSVFVLAQLGRGWVIRSLKGRWTTRVLVLPGKKLIQSGPFKYVSHPNYWVVAVELLSLPLIFDLFATAMVFSLLNAYVLLVIRIPLERKALHWALFGDSHLLVLRRPGGLPDKVIP